AVIDRNGKTHEEAYLLHGVLAPTAKAAWTWPVAPLGYQAAAAGKPRKSGQMCRDQPFHRVCRHPVGLGLVAPFHAEADLRQQVGGN
ncbi:hypothetical protein AB9F38_34365, partial [Rhizobium leguminosarum]